MAEAPRIRVCVVHSPRPREVIERNLELDAGSTVLSALQASAILPAGEGGLADAPGVRELRAGIWGRKARLDHVLRDGDRVEVYRALLVDPKVARRERFRKQGARAAGLFARRKPGAKAGY